MSSQLSAAPVGPVAAVPGGASHTRRELNPRQADTVARVLVAAHEELRAVGYDQLTIRSVAARAGVAPATAYTYFGSKNHLVAELFARRIVEHMADYLEARAPDATATPLERVVALVHEVTGFLGSEPDLAQAVTPALLGSDPDVQHLRLRIGMGWAEWFAGALGPDLQAEQPDLLDALMLLLSGGLLQSGMGLMTYAQLGERLTRSVRVMMEDSR
ncbi:TetR/AcrR family transcriptional regulator [Nocardioides massiliensis]|uniref:AcrR family transcriptional regulator n=1 Tax=Nocardioides massiliensis TaxID=1325935 RepID=A0ABT9NJT6_9ACTN|nr:TetR/AcrR family transcriptional regulator [Nocardioides massiliensis]MDP9820671.1 AcrR family transcriptional regulator [Nocardioides massiliensis]